MSQVQGIDGQSKPSVVYILTIARTVPIFLGGLVRYLCDRGFEISVISSCGPELDSIREEGAAGFEVEIAREISPLKDIVTLWRLWHLLRRLSPDISNVGTPKAGLLGGVAAVLAGVPHRIYTLHCLRLETVQGWKQKLLWVIEWLSCKCAHEVYCVGPSLRMQAIELKVLQASKAKVIANGTCNGIDTSQFCVAEEHPKKASDFKRNLGLASDSVVLGFVGRLTRDKGIHDLYEAFTLLRSRYLDLHLLLVGEYEEGDPVPPEVRERIDLDDRVICTGWTNNPAPYYRIMDVFVQPTYREGFGLAALEAQASCVPVVVTEVTGMKDALIDGVTGFSVPPGNAPMLALAIARLLENKGLRRRMGEKGRDWVMSRFNPEILWKELHMSYVRVLRKDHPHVNKNDSQNGLTGPSVKRPAGGEKPPLSFHQEPAHGLK
jgi:glycosyltransferase involved in cell wall biosynthesis